MAREATKNFEERMFSGNKLAAALTELGISKERFLEAYNTAKIERVKPSEKLKAAQAEIEALKAQLAAKPAVVARKTDKAEQAAA